MYEKMYEKANSELLTFSYIKTCYSVLAGNEKVLISSLEDL